MSGKWQKISLLVVSMFSLFVGSVSLEAKDYTVEELQKSAEGIIQWRTKGNPKTFDEKILLQAGNESSDWLAIGVGRYGIEDANYIDYQALLSQNIENRYQETNQLSESKVTEWHRTGLALLSVGGNPEAVTFEQGNQPINLVADGTFNRGKVAPLDKQGTNGLIWSLILLDSMNYQVASEHEDSREDMVSALLNTQQEDGGFALAGNAKSDVDITGMAITSLAPYYNSEATYATDKDGKNQIKVSQSVDKALDYLSKAQTKTGGFSNGGVENPESITQVLIALTSLGIDPMSDERFIKEDHNLVDALMTFQMKDGGFVHSFEYDKENPTSKPDESNVMASQQVLTALVALMRQEKSMRHLYDMRQEMTSELSMAIKKVELSIADLDKNDKPSKEQVRDIYEQYAKLPTSEKRYVANYHLLSSWIEEYDIPVSDTDFSAINTGDDQSDNPDGSIVNVMTQTPITPQSNLEEDLKKVDDLSLDKVQLSDGILLASTLYQATKTDTTLSQEQLSSLNEKNKQVQELQKEINQLSDEAKNNFYPVDKLSFTDYFKIKRFMKKLDTLTESDRQLVYGYDDINQAYATAKGQFVKVVIGILFVVLVNVLLVVLSVRRKRRKQAKLERYMMTDDDEEYDDE